MEFDPELSLVACGRFSEILTHQALQRRMYIISPNQFCVISVEFENKGIPKNTILNVNLPFAFGTSSPANYAITKPGNQEEDTKVEQNTDGAVILASKTSPERIMVCLL